MQNVGKSFFNMMPKRGSNRQDTVYQLLDLVDTSMNIRWEILIIQEIICPWIQGAATLPQ